MNENNLKKILKPESIISFNEILKYFNQVNIDVIINVIQSEITDNELIENLIYYCYILRSEKCVQNLINHIKFPNDLLLKIIYYNYGQWIISGYDTEDYFKNTMKYLTQLKSMEVLLHTDIIKLDKPLTLHLLGNLDLKTIDQYFSNIDDLSGILDIYVDIFEHLGKNELRSFFSTHSELYGYFILYMNTYNEKKSVQDFLIKNHKNILLIDKLVLITDEIKSKFDYEKEKNLPPHERSQERLKIIINEIQKFENMGEVINILYSHGVFLDESEKEIVLNLLTDSFLKHQILKS